MQSSESLGVLRLIFPSARAGRPVIGWKHFGGPWPLSDFYRELSSGCITDWKGCDTTRELRMGQLVQACSHRCSFRSGSHASGSNISSALSGINTVTMQHPCVYVFCAFKQERKKEILHHLQQIAIDPVGVVIHPVWRVLLMPLQLPDTWIPCLALFFHEATYWLCGGKYDAIEILLSVNATFQILKLIRLYLVSSKWFL